MLIGYPKQRATYPPLDPIASSELSDWTLIAEMELEIFVVECNLIQYEKATVRYDRAP